MRKWQAANGDFSVEATLVDVQVENIQLKKKVGTLIWVELNKLSQDDVRFVKQHNKNANTEIADGWEDYKAPAVESLPEEKGWILYGVAVVDPKLGGPVWIDQPKGIAPMSIYRPLLNSDIQLVLAGDYKKQRLKTASLPWAEIEQNRSNYR